MRQSSIEFVEWEDGSFTVITFGHTRDALGGVHRYEREYPLNKESFDLAIAGMQQNLRPKLEK